MSVCFYNFLYSFTYLWLSLELQRADDVSKEYLIGFKNRKQ